MSSNNIVVIKKESDGKFRGFHRDYDVYCEGQYDYEGDCPFCVGGCDMCNYTKYYTPLEETSIFEANTIEEAILAYDKWFEEMNGDEDCYTVEYGYQFEGLEPNEETIEAMKETDLMLVKNNLKFIFEHITNTNDGFVLANCTPGTIKELAGEALDLLNNPMQKEVKDGHE